MAMKTSSSVSTVDFHHNWDGPQVRHKSEQAPNPLRAKTKVGFSTDVLKYISKEVRNKVRRDHNKPVYNHQCFFNFGEKKLHQV